MSIKKLLSILFICIMSVVSIASCNNKVNDPTQNTGTDDSGNNGNNDGNNNGNNNNGQIEPTVININLGEKIDEATLTEKFNNSQNQYSKYQLSIVGDVTAEDLKTLNLFLGSKYAKGEYTLPLILDFKKANFENNTISDFGDWFGNYLEKITFPDTLRTIGKNVFESVQTLKELTFPDSLISIGDLSFSDIEQLERLIIPDSVMSIGNDVFVRSYLMKELKLPKYLRTIGRSSISLSSSSQFVALDEINLPNLTYVGPGSFLNIRTKKVILPETLIFVDYNAFNVSTSDTELRIPKSLKRIEERSFYYHKTLYLYDTIEYIDMSSKGTETVVYYGTEPKTISGSGLWMYGGIARLYLPNVKEGDPNANPALWETFLLDKNSIYKFYPQYIYFGTEPAQN